MGDLNENLVQNIAGQTSRFQQLFYHWISVNFVIKWQHCLFSVNTYWVARFQNSPWNSQILTTPDIFIWEDLGSCWLLASAERGVLRNVSWPWQIFGLRELGERTTLKKRKEMREPLIYLCTRLWRWKETLVPNTHTKLDPLWCAFVLITHQHVCVKSGLQSRGSGLTAVYL